MPRARALVAAVPQRVWTAVAGLVLLASLGVTLVLAAGLSTWQGAVGNSPTPNSARPPGSVVTPPGSAVIVVPTPSARRPAPAAPPHPRTVVVALPAAPAPVAAPLPVPVAAPPVSAPVPAPPVTSLPRVARGHVEEPGRNTAEAEHRKGAHAKTVKHVKKAKHANHGKRLGWFKNKHGKHS